jgi:rubrerythrin
VKPLITTVDKVLTEAIQSEVESRAYLLEVAASARSTPVREKLLELADRELVHRAQLERRFRDLTGQQAPPPQPVNVDLPGDFRELDLPRALKVAVERERDAESNYRFLAERATEPELAALFIELAEMEWKHKIDLQAEYDASVSDPERFFEDL